VRHLSMTPTSRANHYDISFDGLPVGVIAKLTDLYGVVHWLAYENREGKALGSFSGVASGKIKAVHALVQQSRAA
jgi:hypothetical protein